MKMRALLLLLFIAIPCFAQNYHPLVEVYSGFSYMRIDGDELHNRNFYGSLSPTAFPHHVCFHSSDAIHDSPVFFDQPQMNAPIFRLFRLEGSSSQEVAAKVISVDKQSSPGFSLVSARLENDGIGPAARIRTTVTIANQDSARRITEVEWRLDIFDASLKNRTNQITQSAKINIYAGETANASARFGAVLPDRMIILLQLNRVAFDEGAAWSPSRLCSLETDLATVSCESK